MAGPLGFAPAGYNAGVGTGAMAPEMGMMGDLSTMLADPTAMLGGSQSLIQGMQSMPGPEQESEESAIDKLGPDTELHKKVIQKLNAYFDFSKNAMTDFHARWNWQEQKVQAYIALPDYKQLWQALENNRGAAPEPIKIIVPYSYATLHAAATFIYSVLFGRRPIFPILPVRGTTTEKATYMEAALQSNLELCKGYEAGWQLIWDSVVYNLGVVRIGWAEEYGNTLRITNNQREMTKGLKFAGNKIVPVDPYHFFPDPRVPMSEVNKRGDFVFWLTHQSEMILYDKEADGVLKWVKEACRKDKENPSNGELGPVADSNRRARIGTAKTLLRPSGDIVKHIPVREGTVRLVPKDWGLGDSTYSELWKFSWTPYQIMQAQPLGMAHENHPVAVAEPTSFGHEFGGLALADFIGPFQDMISWLVNSRMENVRTTVNNQFVVDPNRVEMQDLRQPPAGKAIRLKQAAIGTDVREAIMQLTTTDVTAGHFQDLQNFRMLADATTGINDNMRGIQSQGGRRSATEARMAMQAGASRLSQMAIRISSQAMVDITDQMIMNIQQFMPEEMWIEMSGDDNMPGGSTLLKPDMIVGTFNYQISDGSLPYDKLAMLETWKEIMFGIAQDPELRQAKDIVKVFNYVATLGGAKNIRQFDREQQPGFAPGQPPQGAVPAGPALPSPPQFGRSQGLLPPPGQ